MKKDSSFPDEPIQEVSSIYAKGMNKCCSSADNPLKNVSSSMLKESIISAKCMKKVSSSADNPL